MIEEIWKDVPEFKGIYQASNIGRIKSLGREIVRQGKLIWLKEKIMKQHISVDGRYKCSFNNQNCLVHRIIALTWIPNLYNLPDINHKDGNPLNNYYENLEWITKIDNNIHAHKMGLIDLKGEKSPLHILTEEEVKEIRNSKGVYKYRELADMYGVCISNISQIINRNRWKHI